MDKKNIDLLKRIRAIMGSSDHLDELTTHIEDIDDLPLGNLLMKMEEFYTKATTVKSALSFFQEFLGIGKETCIVIVVCSSLWALKPLGRALESMNDHTKTDYIFARAHTYREGRRLLDFFSVGEMTCGLFVESILPNGQAEKLLKKAIHIPTCVLLHNTSPENVMAYISQGADTLIDMSKKGRMLEDQFHIAIQRMFIGE